MMTDWIWGGRMTKGLGPGANWEYREEVEGDRAEAGPAQVVGRKKVSGKELFQKMLDEADGMMTAMSGVGQSDEVMDKIMQLGGVGLLCGDGGGWGSPRGLRGGLLGAETQKSGVKMNKFGCMKYSLGQNTLFWGVKCIFRGRMLIFEGEREFAIA